MSYYKTFVPTEEVMKKYQTSDIDYFSIVLLQTVVYCMKQCKEDDMYNAYTKLQNSLKMIDNSVRDDVYKMIKSQFDNEKKVWFCGWQYAHDNDYDKKDIMDHTLKQLLVLKTVVPTPDYFEAKQNFDTKLHDIEEIIEDMKDILWECWIYEVIEELSPYEKNDDLEDELDEYKTKEGIE